MSSRLLIKVCGLKDLENLAQISLLEPDYVGFVFYQHSKRNALETLDPSELTNLNPEIQKVGVFVDHSIAQIVDICNRFSLDIAQLHGSESPQFCRDLLHALPTVKIWKAFGLDNNFDFSCVTPYESNCSQLLFDTKSDLLGGSGSSFDWSILKGYRGTTPFIISGGIGNHNITSLLEVAKELPLATGIDINSRVEIAPGLKCPEQVGQLFKQVRQ